MNKFDILHLLFTIVIVVIAFVIGWCRGESSARDVYASSASVRSKTERENIMHILFEERLKEATSEAYQHGWEDGSNLSLNRKPLKTNSPQRAIHWRELFTNQIDRTAK